MKLYYMPGACSLATHIVLEWIGKPYEIQQVPRDKLKSPEYLKINPLGAVPALDVDGWVLTENVAILDYLAETRPDLALTGDGSAKGRAEVHRWLAFVNSDMHPAFRPLFGATAYLGDAAAIAKTKEHAKTRLHGMFEIVNEQLDGQYWLTGTRSIADPYLYVLLRWAKAQKIDLAELDNLETFFRNMRQDAGVQKAVRDQGLD